MDAAAYLDRIGVEPETVALDVDGLARLQRAHVLTVPFETLAITGHPFGDREGEGVELDTAHLYEKVVTRERGGFCYELNEPFRWLLADRGFDVERRAAQVVADGDPGQPANHLTLVVSLDRPYLVDVGLGSPKVRRPVPMDGTVTTDETGLEWRVAESGRPNLGLALQNRRNGDDWTTRFVFRDVPRDLSFFEATCEYLATAPESGFTGDPVAIVATEDGQARLDTETFSRPVGDETTERPITPDEFDDLLERAFGVTYPRD